MINDKKISIDIAIVPPEEIIQKCIYINSQLDNSHYLSFGDGYYPHITLGMACVNVDDLDIISNELELIIKDIQNLTINVIGYEGGNYFSFQIEKNNFINNLHRTVMDILKKYSHYGEATSETFYEPNKIRPDSGLIKWVNNFEIEHAYDKYAPHISIGEGDRPQIDFPFMFKADKIAVFHLGAHGSCREKLKEFNF